MHNGSDDFFESSATSGVIVHLDCNDFYAAVERKARGLGDKVPIAIFQENRVIACDLNAQKQGVQRGQAFTFAQRTCPELVKIELPVLEVKEEGFGSGSGIAPADLRKTDLRKYRKEGEKVFNIVKRFMQKRDVFQRSGIGDAFLQLFGHVTEFTNTQFQDTVTLVNAHTDTEIKGDVTSFLLQDFILMRAALISFRIRNAVKHELGYSLSAGISTSQHVSKTATTLCRPVGQCIVCCDAAQKFLAEYPMSAIPGLATKYGQKLEPLVGRNPKLSAIQRLNVDRLARALGGKEEAQELLQVSSGLASGPLTPKHHNASITALKAFSTVTHDMKFVKAWLKVLCAELIDRMIEDFESTLRKPLTVTVSLWVIPKKEYPFTKLFASTKDLYATSLSLLEGLAVHLPTNKLSVVVADFKHLPMKQLIQAYPIPDFYERLPSPSDSSNNTLISVRVVSPMGQNLTFEEVDPARTYLHEFKEQICKRLELSQWAAYYLSLFTSDEGIFQLTANNRTLQVNGITKHCKLFLEYKPELSSGV